MTSEGAWSSVLLPIADHVAPPHPHLAFRRVRSLALVGAALPWLLPLTPLVGLPHASERLAFSIAWIVPVLVALFLAKRVRWGIWALAAATVAAGAYTVRPPSLWPAVLAGVCLATLAVSAARCRWLPPPPLDLPQPRLGQLAWSVVGVLVFREFAMFAIHVPTGSMEPTIRADGPGGEGDSLAVDRSAYTFGEPQRFDVAVFDYPLHRPTAFVKRVIGLPGETVEIRDGNVWIDGRVLRKPPLVQESLWHETFPRPSPRAVPKKVADCWTSTAWEADGDGARCTVGRSSGVLTYAPRLELGDLRLRFQPALEPSGDAACELQVRITSRGHAVVASLTMTNGTPGGTLAVDRIECGRWTGELPDTVQVLDGEASVLCGGRVLASGGVPVEPAGRNAVDLTARGGKVRAGALRLDQDQKWLAARDGTSRWEVPAGAYLVLGDNSRQSEDSREWRVSTVALRSRGDPLRFAPTYPGERGEQTPNLVRRDGRLSFRDSDGVPRSLASADVVGAVREEPAPFVPRSHFVGRAVFVFWPWFPPDGGFRPRFIR